MTVRWIERLGRIATRWKLVGLAALAAGFSQLGARIVLPDVASDALREGMRQGGGLFLYDLLAGGATSRGAILGLGLMPYVGALVWMRAARLLFPRFDAFAKTEVGGDKTRQWTRRLAVGLSALQAVGFARYAQSVPGVVANPGWGFIVQTTVILTSATVVTMLLTEGLLGRLRSADTSDVAPDGELRPAVLGPFDGKLLEPSTSSADELLRGVTARRGERVGARPGADERD
jgi:hypothetical protein